MFRPLDTPFVCAVIEAETNEQKIKHAVSWATMWVRFKQSLNESGAIIFDIDDTLVDERERPIKPVVDLYRMCIDLKLPCYIVTARPDTKKNRSETHKMLRTNDITNYKMLFMMPGDVEPTVENIGAFKYNAREFIQTKMKKEILLNCGDQLTDHTKHPRLMHSIENDAAILFPASYACLKMPTRTSSCHFGPE